MLKLTLKNNPADAIYDFISENELKPNIPLEIYKRLFGIYA